MRILFIGDVMGRSGREALKKHLPTIREQLNTDVVIVNGENAAHGKGITEKMCKQFYDWGVDCITTGNHVWDQRELMLYIDKDRRVLRPLNYPDNTPGKGIYKHELQDGRNITIINIMGNLYMPPPSLDDAFSTMDKHIADIRLGNNTNAVFVDFHAEVTSEKMALAHHLDGKVSALVGTHTHIPTADAQIFKGGTAFQADAGMTGDYDSVIGVQKDLPVWRFSKKLPPSDRFRPASGEGTVCGVFVETNDNTGLADTIKPVRVGANLKETM
jgi:metallophosphoesterase (TIGR00282 family)